MLVIHLPLNGDTHNQGLSNIAVNNNGATIDNNGKIGKCYYFDGAGKYISLTNPLVNTSEISCSVWVKPLANTRANEQIINIGTSSGWKNIRFGILQKSTNQFIFHVSDGTNQINYSCISDTIALNEWINIICTYKEKTLKMYLNGELVKTYSINFDPSFSGITNIGIGAAPSGAESFTGYINDVRIYSHCLSLKEISELKKLLVLHYPLDRGGFGQENLDNFSSIASNWTMESLSGSNYIDSTYGNVIKLVTNSGNQRMYHSVKSTLWQTGQDYTVSFLAKADIDGRTCDMSRSLSDLSPLFTLSTEWKRYSGKITSTTTPNGGTLSFRINQSGATVYITQIKLELGDKVTPYVPNSAESSYAKMGLNDNIEYDTSGFGNNGTRTGTFSWDSDTPRYSVSTYMPKTSLITHPNPVDGGENQEWSCAMWVKLDTVNQSGIAMNNFNSGNNIVHLANGTPLLYLNSGANDYYIYGSQAVESEVWTHIVFVFKNSEGLRNIYINGVLKNNYGINKTSTPSGIPDTVTVGTNLAGYISDYRIYATALSAEDVLSLYQLGGSIDSNGVFHTYEYVEG